MRTYDTAHAGRRRTRTCPTHNMLTSRSRSIDMRLLKIVSHITTRIRVVQERLYTRGVSLRSTHTLHVCTHTVYRSFVRFFQGPSPGPSCLLTSAYLLKPALKLRAGFVHRIPCADTTAHDSPNPGLPGYLATALALVLAVY